MASAAKIVHIDIFGRGLSTQVLLNFFNSQLTASILATLDCGGSSLYYVTDTYRSHRLHAPTKAKHPAYFLSQGLEWRFQSERTVRGLAG